MSLIVLFLLMLLLLLLQSDPSQCQANNTTNDTTSNSTNNTTNDTTSNSTNNTTNDTTSNSTNNTINNTVTYWTAKSIDGYSNYFVIIGDPSVYLRNFASNNFESRNSFVQVQWNSLSRKTNFPSIAYDIGRDLVAISQDNPKSINIDTLYLALSRTGYYKRILNDIPLSGYITGLAFSTNFNLLYWVDKLYQYIGVVELEKYRWTKVLETNLDQPHSIALHEFKGFIFWSDVGANPTIERSNMAGEERTVIVDFFSSRPIHLVVEKKLEKLFWIDGCLKSSDFYGKDVTAYETSDKNANTFTSFVLYKDIVLFGSEKGAFVSYEFSRSFPNMLVYLAQFFVVNSTNITSGSLDSKEESMKMTVINPCDSNRNCDHLCIPSNLTEYVCFCNFGFQLSSDGRTCNTSNVKDEHLLVSDSKQGTIFQVDPQSGKVEVILKLDFPDYVENMAYLEVEGVKYIYYTLHSGDDVLRYDTSKGISSSFYSAGSSITDIVSSQSTGSVYFSVSTGNIYEAKSRTNARLFVNKKDENIQKLFVDHGERKLFYSECRSKSLVEVDLGTYEETKRMSIGVCATPLDVDLQAGFAYFVDLSKNLMKFDLNKQTTSRLLARPGNISDLTVDDDYIYLLENSNFVTKIDKHTLQVSSLTGQVFVSAKEILFTNSMPGNDASTSLPPVVAPVSSGVVAVVVVVVVVVAVVVVVVVVVVVKFFKRQEIKRLAAQHYDEIIESPNNDDGYDIIGSIPIYIIPVLNDPEGVGKDDNSTDQLTFN